MDNIPAKNLAETLSEVLPKPQMLEPIDATLIPGFGIRHAALPKGFQLQEVKVDLEALLPHPRRTKAVAQFAEARSFLDYIERHRTPETVAWCKFDPQTFELRFTAVFDEHAKEAAGWRAHRAVFEPDMSAEWKAWKGRNAQPMQQVEFAEWIQEHESDINSSAEGYPTSLQMLQMATEFVMQEERSLKSAVRLQSGGVRLTYIADPTTGTVEHMQAFEKFALGIPVFQGGAAWAMFARLKYRQHAGSVKFHYELVRPDHVHEHAAKKLIEQVKADLGSTPLLMGTCN